MSIAIDVTGLHVRYGDVLALSDTNVTVNSGKVTALIGMNGSGKSSLFNAIIGSVKPQAGQIQIMGRDPSVARRTGVIGYLPQSETVDWDFPVSVRDVVMMGRYGFQSRVTRRPRTVDREAVAAALERVGLSSLAERQIGQLSGGQRKRAFVARSIAQEARVLLLDEPFAGVDKSSEVTMVALLRELADGGAAVFVSTHDLHALPVLADEAIVLRNKPIFRGSVAEALAPETLARAFGLDVAAGGEDA
ncbi:MAG: metal ABC transporter ATP-binding protein [Actinomycetales bacterium]|nr:metal ABC transporter ATP-binding protein [Actinomycetales bacterium]